MTRLLSLPAQDGYSMPAEFAPQDGVLLVWPVRPGSWGKNPAAAQRAFCDVMRAASRSERVWLLAGHAHFEEARAAAGAFATVLEIETDDAWARDIGPTFVSNDITTRGINWSFNAWGGAFDGLYGDWARDDAAAEAFCRALSVDCYHAGEFILEGGSICSDGEGTLLVTEACLLSPGRNPRMTRAQIEQTLKNYLGAEKVLWLPRGIYLDETNEHVDNVCAFLAPGEVVLAWTDDPTDPQYPLSLADYRYLASETDARGRRLVIHKLPIPDHPVCIAQADMANFVFEPGEQPRQAGDRLAASYVNFYFTNDAVLLPQFGGDNAVSDARAAALMRRFCSGREIIPINTRALLLGGGNIHCITQQIPKGAIPMSEITVAAVQMRMTQEPAQNLAHAEALVREAAKNGAEIVLLPELFERPYFCQERRYEYLAYAQSVDENPAVARFRAVAAELSVALPVSFYEREGNRLYNSAVMIDADGALLGVYRKTHIPDDHYYQEKFYFSPGDTGFRVFQTRYGAVGVGICWDQWFPEAARAMALSGADLLLYPTAIGSEPILACDSMPHWRRVMQGHAAANILPVAAANRVGVEQISPCAENGMQSSSLSFYGSSFLTDETGELLTQADREHETILYARYDFGAIRQARLDWGLFRDRRPECYTIK